MMSPFAGITAAFLQFLAAVGPGAIAVTLVVDWVRNHVDPTGTKVNKVMWQYLALAVGIGGALAVQLNMLGPLISAIPALANQSPRFAGVWGQVFTGLGMAGSSTYWHANLALKKSARLANNASALSNDVAPVTPVVKSS
jgi:hypothetical protein